MAKLWRSVTGEFGRRYSPRPTRSTCPARCSRSRYSLGTPISSTSRGRTMGNFRASASTRSALAGGCITYTVSLICQRYATVSVYPSSDHTCPTSHSLGRQPKGRFRLPINSHYPFPRVPEGSFECHLCLVANYIAILITRTPFGWPLLLFTWKKSTKRPAGRAFRQFCRKKLAQEPLLLRRAAPGKNPRRRGRA
jgi:hypothetical protein